MKIVNKFTGTLLVVTMIFSMAACTGNNSEKKTTEVPEAVSEQKEVTEQTTEPQEELEQGNLLKNGDISNGINNFGTYCADGSCFITANAAEQLEISVPDIGTVSHGAQVYYDGFKIRQGVIYSFSFDVKSTIERDMEVRVQINGSDYHAYYKDIVDMGEETKHYEAEFKMEEGTDPAPRLCFNVGLTDTMKEKGITAESTPEHTITIDNIVIEIKDASGIVAGAPEYVAPKAKINQLGYMCEDSKIAVFNDLDEDDTSFKVVDSSGNTAFEGKMSAVVEYMYAGEKNCTGDFSELKTPGKYKIVTSKGEESVEFSIGDDCYNSTFNDVAYMIYSQRCGQELTDSKLGDFTHSACHNTKATIYGTDKQIDVTGGWHDAGDFGRYVVPAAKTVADILLAYEKNPKVFGADNIDALEEAKYELDWMLKMQDSETGGVYHKVTCKDFPGTVMPEDETEPLVVAPLSKTASADFAAVMAMASRVYSQDKAFSDKCLKAAERAFAYYVENKNVRGYTNPSDITTGEYGDGSSKDEYFWAAAELYKTTQKNEYKQELATSYEENMEVDGRENLGGLGWMDMSAYGAYAALTTDLLLIDSSNLRNDIQRDFIAAADSIVETNQKTPYMVSRYEAFEWGSNMGVANDGMVLLMANDIVPNADYVKCAKYQLNYLLGVNATGYCFVTGAGTIYPEHPHHRVSQVKGKAVPGMLVGGPDNGLEDTYARAVLQGVARAKCYTDNDASYSTNEVTIYWNSPLIYLMASCMK